jgi:hypothetical protein
MTYSIVTALKIAEESGFKVSQKVIDKAVNFIERCARKDGSFRYCLNIRRPGRISKAGRAERLSARSFLSIPIRQR